MRYCAVSIVGLLLGIVAPAAGQAATDAVATEPAATMELRKFETRYYTMYTDLDDEHVREATIRMTRMAEEYHERTKGFSGRIRSKFPFFLFKSEALYYQAGGRPGTAGVFMGSPSAGFRLMALAGEMPDDRTWHTVQHEGFHQFAHAVIGGDLPIWVNEGLAEYFGESLFTGDGFVTGVIPPWRLERIKATFAAERFLSIEQMMLMSHNEWNLRMSGANYDQAWAMVHFLAHAEDGRYQKAFTQFMNMVGRGAQWGQAWSASFGSPKGFEERWRKYWAELPANPTERLYVRATLETLMSFLARAAIEGQLFDDFDSFRTAATGRQLKLSDANWLPPALLEDALSRSREFRGQWRLDASVRPARLTYVMEDQTQLVATAALKGPVVEKISVMTDELPRVIAEARKLLEAGKRAEARALLQVGMKQSARSPAMDEARQLVAEIRGGVTR